MNAAERRLRERIARHGPVPWSTFMEAALYDPDGGFYATGGVAGRRGDFLTSPEVGPLFGAVVAHALDAWWEAMGRPTPFLVVDAGAGPGTLARTVLAARPACAPALRCVLVERSAAQRARHGQHLALEPPSATGLGVPSDEPVAPADGPLVVSLAELPKVAVHVILANELLDNLPVDIAVGTHEALVGWDGERFVEVLVPGTHALAVAGRAPLARAAARWVDAALERLLPGGRLVAVDYMATTAEIAGRDGPVPRTYRGHERAGDPLDAPGTKDLTVDVPLDQLPPPTTVMTQAAWLRAHGLDELVAEGKRLWSERAGVGDLAALRARSRVAEAEALTDLTGLGAFTVAEWHA